MSRFKELADSYGFTIHPVYAMINNIWCRRPDIESVRYKGHHIMTVPRKMLNHPESKYRTLEGNEQPMYFDREYHLRNWNIILKKSPHLRGIEAKKLELEKQVWLGGKNQK